MIYKLDQDYLMEADSNGLEFICMSETGLYFLVKASSLPSSITELESYPDTEYAALLADPEWIQPGADL